MSQIPYADAGAAMFGLSQYAANSLFGTGTQFAAHRSLPVCTYKTTPNEFAEVLEKFLEVEKIGEVLPIFLPPDPGTAIYDTNDRMPPETGSYRCWDADGNQYAASWMGDIWWGDGGRELKIVRWQELSPSHSAPRGGETCA